MAPVEARAEPGAGAVQDGEEAAAPAAPLLQDEDLLAYDPDADAEAVVVDGEVNEDVDMRDASPADAGGDSPDGIGMALARVLPAMPRREAAREGERCAAGGRAAVGGGGRQTAVGAAGGFAAGVGAALAPESPITPRDSPSDNTRLAKTRSDFMAICLELHTMAASRREWWTTFLKKLRLYSLEAVLNMGRSARQGGFGGGPNGAAYAYCRSKLKRSAREAGIAIADADEMMFDAELNQLIEILRSQRERSAEMCGRVLTASPVPARPTRTAEAPNAQAGDREENAGGGARTRAFALVEVAVKVIRLQGHIITPSQIGNPFDVQVASESLAIFRLCDLSELELPMPGTAGGRSNYRVGARRPTTFDHTRGGGGDTEYPLLERFVLDHAFAWSKPVTADVELKVGGAARAQTLRVVAARVTGPVLNVALCFPLLAAVRRPERGAGLRVRGRDAARVRGDGPRHRAAHVPVLARNLLPGPDPLGRRSPLLQRGPVDELRGRPDHRAERGDLHSARDADGGVRDCP